MNLAKLKKNHKLFRTLSGLTPPVFDRLVELVTLLWEQHAYARTPKKQRKHAVGAGRRYRLTLEQSVFLTLLHFRTYETYAFLGFLFHIDFSTAYRYIQRIEPLIDACMDIPREPKILSKEEVLRIVDATEQETGHRGGSGYSGKKRKQTIKTQVVVTAEGRIKHISRSVPGNMHDKKLYDIAGASADMGDLGYVGTGMLLPHKSSKLRKLTTEQRAENAVFAARRILVEHLFAHLKQWKILAHRFRQSLTGYNRIFRSVCGLKMMMQGA